MKQEVVMHDFRKDAAVVIHGNRVPEFEDMSADDLATMAVAGEWDEDEGRWHYHVATGCLKGAMMAEKIASGLRCAASSAEDDDLAMSKDVLDEVLEYVDALRVVITAARWRRKIPVEELRVCQSGTRDQAQYEKLLKDLAHF